MSPIRERTESSARPWSLPTSLLLAGELGNSEASDVASLQRLWPRLVELRLNTVLTPVYWELLEPEEGAFDFSLVDELLRLARHHGQKLVLLWFGAWKNSMSCYAPSWVKRDTQRFPRARLHDGSPLEILSAFSQQNLAADKRAFARLMAYLRDHDRDDRTVVLVQVENEIGMLEQARDTCDEARSAFEQPVPMEFLSEFVKRDGEVAQRCRARQYPSGANWRAVFGEGVEAEEIFQAYYYARYVNAVADSGKREHDVPMFVNAALNRPGWKPGRYPSAGPLPHLFDVWKLAAPAVDFLAPDIYYPNFEHWCERYAVCDNPLFIPEATNDKSCALHALYAIGAHGAFGFSPFTVEAIDPSQSMLPECYGALRLLSSEIQSCRRAHALGAVLLTRETPNTTLELGRERLNCAHDYTWEWSGPGRLAAEWPKAGALLLATAPDEYIVLGSGVIVTFAPAESTNERIGITSIDELQVGEHGFVQRRRLNGDESHQGRHLRLPLGGFSVQKIRLYRYG